MRRRHGRQARGAAVPGRLGRCPWAGTGWAVEVDHWLSPGHGGWRWRPLWLAIAGGVPKWGFGLNGHDHLVVAQCGDG